MAAHAGTDVIMTSSILRGLEGRGLVTRTPDPADARIRRLAVTDAGRRLALQSIGVVEAADAAFFAPLADEPRLVHLLSRLVNAPTDVLKDVAVAPPPRSRSAEPRPDRRQ